MPKPPTTTTPPTLRFAPRLTLVLLAGSLLATPAQSAPAQATPPDAGTLLQEMRPAPVLPRESTGVLPETPERRSPPLDAAVRFVVRGFHVRGAEAFPEAELQALIAEGIGQELTLADIDALAQRITRRYRDAGYPLARAYLPAQEIRDGIVDVAVLEGRLGALRIDNQSTLRDSQVAARLAGLKEGEAIAGDALERELLLLSDLPGVEVASTLRPGASVGTTDLDVRLSGKSPYGGSVELDNYGDRYSGSARLGGNFTAGNLFGLSDTVALRALASELMEYGRLAWQVPVGPAGTQLGAAWSQMHYRLGKDFADLDAHGTARIGSLYLLHPFVRGRSANLNGQLNYDAKRLVDDIDSTGTRSRKSIDLWTAGLSGDRIDGLFGGGMSRASLAYSAGTLHLDADAAALDDAGYRTAGSFDKVNLAAARLQRLVGDFTLYGSVQAQAAGKNLSSAEKMALGGPLGVRAYPQGEALSDDAWLVTLELRYALAERWQISLFDDQARGRLNHTPIATDTDNVRRLAGYGIGLIGSYQDFSVQMGLAWRDGAPPTADVDRNPRVWVQAVQRF